MTKTVFVYYSTYQLSVAKLKMLFNKMDNTFLLKTWATQFYNYIESKELKP